MEHACLECGTRLLGRIDKKFCNDQCRNAYHNRENRDDDSFIRNINSILRKNRNILKELTPDGKSKVKKHQMEQHGYNFKYFTHVYKTKEKRVYYFCYEHGYLPLEDDYFALVVNKEI
ncbi:MAG: hypothetical protein CVT99_10285 [Bacteroidetes bacterium HGW-Bacteroidetes-16]|jgi:hypothetical protein|nr:MAG: hypothetical protein CVT99_10285 [Bacteroidetes bacterium HGW-Bacteroidetes-16]